MKIILEFDGDETELAEMSYKGPQLHTAAEDFRNFLRNAIKYNDKLSMEELRAYTFIQTEFFNHFGDLLKD